MEVKGAREEDWDMRFRRGRRRDCARVGGNAERRGCILVWGRKRWAMERDDEEKGRRRGCIVFKSSLDQRQSEQDLTDRMGMSPPVW